MKVVKITFEMAKPFIMKIHYARRMPCIQYAFGLLDDNDELVGVVTFGQPASPSLCIGVAGTENKKNVLELNRLVLTTNKKNSASFLVGKALKQLPKNTFVVSYADIEGWGHVGYVYQATNFLYTGMTVKRTDVYNGGSNKHQRHVIGDRSKRQLRSVKHRYVYLVGNKKKMLEQLKYPILPYPKGDSRHYDTECPQPLLTPKLINKDIENDDDVGDSSNSEANLNDFFC